MMRTMRPRRTLLRSDGKYFGPRWCPVFADRSIQVKISSMGPKFEIRAWLMIKGIVNKGTKELNDLINSLRFVVLWTLPNPGGEGELASVCGVPQPRLSDALAVFR